MATNSEIRETIERSVQDATGYEEPTADLGSNIFSWSTRHGETLPTWWSRARDSKLAAIWRTNNHLATAVYNTQSKLVGIPPRVVAKDPSNSDHVKQAEEMTYALQVTPDFGRSWVYSYSKFIEDFLTQDNGAFFEVIGGGDPNGPIVGMPYTVRHLDSYRCTRTGNSTYPVLYEAADNRRYKMHYTRVIYMSQMPSSKASMNGVGFCAVSRCIEVARTLSDMVLYKQERLGSRPANQILVGKGVTAEQIFTAFIRQQEEADNQGLMRFSKTVAIGSENERIGIEKIELNDLGPFDEIESTNLSMYLIASAMGMDADEIWPVLGGGGNKSDSNLRRMRSRGRLPAQVTSEIATQFTFKFLPPHLEMVFDFNDDEEDQQRAVIRDIRGRNRERDLTTGSIHIRTARLRMLRDGDVDRTVFNEMELVDGRLPDGTPVSILFASTDPVYVRLLDFMEKPLSVLENIVGEDGSVDDSRVNEVIIGIQNQRANVLSEWSASNSARLKDKINSAYWALDWLEERYVFAAGRGLPAVPMASRNLRVDTRVQPEEKSPGEGDTSPAEQIEGDFSENVDV